MKTNRDDIDKNDYLPPRAEEAIQRLKPQFNSTREENWHALQERIQAENKKERRFQPWMVAATLVLLLALSGFVRFYTVTISGAQHIQRAIQLPDGSTVALAAESELHYQPYWWPIARKLQLEGKAFFEVKKGNRFQVSSFNGSTTVLGTSFTIESREDNYLVACRSGRVLVKANEQEIQLGAEEFILWDENGQMRKESGESALSTQNWLQPMMSFQDVALADVLSRLEKEYDIKIVKEGIPDGQRFTAKFRLPLHAEEALQIVCSSTALHYLSTGDRQFKIQTVESH